MLRDFCIKKKSIPYIPEFSLKKALAHIWRVKNGQIKKGRISVLFHDDLDVFEAMAYKEHKSYNKKKLSEKDKDEEDFKEFLDVLRHASPYYLGSQ